MCLVNGESVQLSRANWCNVLRSTARPRARPAADIAVSTGVHDGRCGQVAACGAAAVQVCTAIHKYGYEVIGEMN